MLRIVLSLVLSAAIGRCACGAEPPAEVYVAPDGNDAWSGRFDRPNANRTDGPVASFTRAQQLVRSLQAGEPNRRGPIVVALRGGRYSLDKTITFGPEDSGTTAAPIIYQAFGNERPILSGGVRIRGWKETGGRWQVVLDEVRKGRWSFAQFFVDDQRRPPGIDLGLIGDGSAMTGAMDNHWVANTSAAIP